MATRATCDLCDIMLKDCAHIQESEAEWKNRKAMRAGKPEVTPIYTMNDAEGVLHHFVPCNYNEIIRLNDNLEIRFCRCGASAWFGFDRDLDEGRRLFQEDCIFR